MQWGHRSYSITEYRNEGVSTDFLYHNVQNDAAFFTTGDSTFPPGDKICRNMKPIIHFH
jgi:hypothetical protein